MGLLFPTPPPRPENARENSATKGKTWGLNLDVIFFLDLSFNYSTHNDLLRHCIVLRIIEPNYDNNKPIWSMD